MRRLRRPRQPQNMIDFIEALQNPINNLYTHTVQNPLSRFFQRAIFVDEVCVGAIFTNLDAIRWYQNELNTVRIIGIDGTFKTVPQVPPELKNGSLLTFQVVFKNVVRAISFMIYSCTDYLHNTIYFYSHFLWFMYYFQVKLKKLMWHYLIL